MKDYISEVKSILSNNGRFEEAEDIFSIDSEGFDNIAEEIAEILNRKDEEISSLKNKITL